MLKDGHIHTHYCPHGSDDSFEQYAEAAVSAGFSEISFTEHAPLPASFRDPAPDRDSAMRLQDLAPYLQKVSQMKKAYAGVLKINTGLEVDFIEGFENETAALLNEYGPFLDDAILSVHFLPVQGQFACLDFSEEEFGRIAQKAGSVESIYRLYYDTVLKSIQSDLGPYKPKRIGHITLVHKFQRRFPCPPSFAGQIERILQAAQQNGCSLDYNGAGVVKPLCQETYPPRSVARMAAALGVPLVYGSDAHTAAGIGQGLTEIDQTLLY